MNALRITALRRARLAHATDYAGWRDAARSLLQDRVPPHEVEWSVGDMPTLLGTLAEPVVPAAGTAVEVPRAFVELAGEVIRHHSPERFGLLYHLLWRIARGDRHLLQVASDPAVRRAEAMARAVRREAERMKPALRFREIRAADGVCYVAWFEPEHYVVEAAAPFFAQRFVNLRWSILTPYRSAHWTGGELRFDDGVWRADVATEADLDAYWRVCFAGIFSAPAAAMTGRWSAAAPERAAV